MADTFFSRVRNAWNVFRSRDPTTGYVDPPINYGMSSTYRLDRTYSYMSTERSFVLPIYNQIAIDISEMVFEHVRVDQNETFQEVIMSSLNEILTLQANIDQTAKAFIQDIVISLFDEGVVAVVPIDTDVDITDANVRKYYSMRTGKVIQWFPRHVKVRIYDDREGQGVFQEIMLPKESVAIIENPFYAIMNEANSTLKRLMRKLQLLDQLDDRTSQGKLDILIQLPYTIRTPAKREQAEMRRKDIEMQLAGSTYGIAYIDGTERVTQLNRPAENNLMAQVQYLQGLVYDQLGYTEAIHNGTATEQQMLTYYNRSLSPVVSAITLEFTRKFLTKTARTQGHRITGMREPFKFVPVGSMAEIADSLTRNEILTSNEFRGIIGFRPSSQPEANVLRNKNLNPQDFENGVTTETVDSQNGTGIEEDTTAEMAGLSTDQMYELFAELVNGLETDIDSVLQEVDDEYADEEV